MLDVRSLPGGKTADSVLHIVNALTDAAKVFSKFTGESFQELKTLKSQWGPSLDIWAEETQSTSGDLCEIYGLWRQNLRVGTFVRYMG